jgi:YVTN family beta-propeller protein
VMLVMGKPWGLAVSPDGARVYVARDVTGDSDTISAIDTATNQVVATIDTPRGLRWITVKP